MIGYYVHHRGAGHLNRMQSIADQLAEPLTVLSSLGAPVVTPASRRWIQLPVDDSGAVFIEPTAGGTLHWVPQHHRGLRTRMALVAQWVAAADPTLVVVDVSVEIATICRLMGVPTVVMAMRGDRSDRPHRTAYDSAHALIAPWAIEFAEPGWPSSLLDKTFHAGAISRFADRSAPPKVPHTGARRVLVLWGTGGDQQPRAAFAAAVSAVQGWEWRFAGGSPMDQVDQDEVWRLLCWADVVITHAGQNAVAEVAASSTPAVIIADERPHGEQRATAAALDRAGIAIGLDQWPDAGRWPGLLEAALANGGDQWRRWAPPTAAARAAAFLSATAAAVRAGSPGDDTSTEVAS